MALDINQQSNRELHLNNNVLTEIDRYAFHDMPNLQHLRVNNNSLTCVHELLFDALSGMV